jgi:hypothetical protein
VAGDEVSALRFGKVVQEVFHVRLVHIWRNGSSTVVQRRAEFLRHVRHGQATPALKKHFNAKTPRGKGAKAGLYNLKEGASASHSKSLRLRSFASLR